MNDDLYQRPNRADHAAAMALIGIGYAVLDVADAIRSDGGDLDALIEATRETP